MGTIIRSSFAFEQLNAYTISGADCFTLDSSAVVANIGAEPARVEEPFGGYIPSLTSTILAKGTHISGALLAVIQTVDNPLSESVFRLEGWDDFYRSNVKGAGDGAPVLLKSSQDSVGRVELIPARVLVDPGAPAEANDYEVKLNLWFSPAGTDCGIHREHTFIETHTQIMGFGRMQKFSDDTHASLFEDQLLAPGQTQPSIFGRWDTVTGQLVYPWHQYHADTDVTWLAVEYHKLAV